MNYKKFDFKDMNLVPKMCIVESRNDCDASLKFGDYTFRLPIVPANMECVIDENLAIQLAKEDFFYIMHRFDINQIEFVRKMKSLQLISSISIGVNDDSFILLDNLIEDNLIPDYITIDIAHGHSIKMKRMLEYIKSKNIKSFIIAGNVSTREGVEDLEDWGADCVKVGIGPGSACTTYPATGFGSRNCQASTINECAKVARKPLMADGGIREAGDISKSLVMGATMVMVGGMLSGYKDSPGNVVEYDGRKYKEFWGSASQFQSNKNSRIEGKKNLIEFKDKSIIDEMNYLRECLQSSISYGGGNNLDCFDSVKYTIF